MFWLLEIGASGPERNLMFWANEERNCLFLVFGFILSRAIRNVPSFRFSWKKLVNNQLGCWSNCKKRIWLLYWYFYQLCASKDRFFFPLHYSLFGWEVLSNTQDKRNKWSLRLRCIFYVCTVHYTDRKSI